MTDQIIIFDTTLRDGEQSPGATMSVREKITIAHMLDDMGVNVIEAGFAAASPGDLACIQEVSRNVNNATICSLSRAIKGDIAASAEALKFAVKPRIHTFISTSAQHIEHQFRMTYDQVLETIDETVRYARSFCDDVEWSAMDATRSDPVFLMKAVGTAIQAGAKTVNIPDTVGYTTPDEYRQCISGLVSTYPNTVFSVHCHNDLGLATANSLAGIMGGARQVECTINGIGERAGNASMEEVVMVLKTRPALFGCDTGIDTKQIYNISRFISAVTTSPIQKNKAIVGRNAFAHESGIHQDGMLKNRDTYEIMRPESVGVNKSELVMGKHSGRAAFSSWTQARGIILEKDQMNDAFTRFKAIADSKKHVTDDDIYTAIDPSAEDEQHLRLVSIHTSQQEFGENKADIIVEMAGEQKALSAIGSDPVKAVFNAINTIVPGLVPIVQEFESHSIAFEDIQQTEASIIVKHQNIAYSGNAYDPDVMKASASAYISAVNKILAVSVLRHS